MRLVTSTVESIALKSLVTVARILGAYVEATRFFMTLMSHSAVVGIFMEIMGRYWKNIEIS